MCKSNSYHIAIYGYYTVTLVIRHMHYILVKPLVKIFTLLLSACAYSISNHNKTLAINDKLSGSDYYIIKNDIM